jgi:hypothetical protein
MWAAAGDHGGVQGIADQVGVVVAAHRVAQQVPGGQVQHAGQVQPAFVGGDVGDLAAPGHLDLVRVEQAAQQIGGGRRSMVLAGQAAAPAGPPANDAVGAHQPLDPPVVGTPAAPPELGMHPRAP